MTAAELRELVAAGRALLDGAEPGPYSVLGELEHRAAEAEFCDKAAPPRQARGNDAVDIVGLDGGPVAEHLYRRTADLLVWLHVNGPKLLDVVECFSAYVTAAEGSRVSVEDHAVTEVPIE